MDRIESYIGCLLGGAVGDALGYPVEFLTKERIRVLYGGNISSYHLEDDIALISDDTQMTLFTAVGLIYGYEAKKSNNSSDEYYTFVAKSYADWLKTQLMRNPDGSSYTWLGNVAELFSRRAPGNTCLSALKQGGASISKPVNSSKGCGGVMRVAPVGLFLGGMKDVELIDVAKLGAETAAITHGHELGYFSAAVLAELIAFVIRFPDLSLKEGVNIALRDLRTLFPDSRNIGDFKDMIYGAITLAELNISDSDAIKLIGEGWMGDEALSISIFCAHRYKDDFEKAIVAAVNHSGDSDSTGSITGNIIGAHLGSSAIPKKYTDNLEHKDLIVRIAKELAEIHDATDIN